MSFIMTTDPPLLIGARLKIQNAHQHIGRLRATTEKMFERAIAEIAPETDATGNTVLSVRTSCEMLPGIPLALGDAVHNLRSSLDYAVSEICFVSSGSQGWSNRVEFPFHGTEKDLKTKVEGLKKEGMPNDIARYILEEVKPWKEQSTNPGNFVLWAMKQLDNDDKHKLLIPVGAVTSLKKVSFVANGPNVRNFLCQDNTIVAGPNGKFPVIGFGGGATISFENFGLPNWELLFAGDQYFPGRPVIPTLEIFAQLTSNVVEVLMRLFNERMSAGQEITQD